MTGSDNKEFFENPLPELYGNSGRRVFHGRHFKILRQEEGRARWHERALSYHFKGHDNSFTYSDSNAKKKF